MKAPGYEDGSCGIHIDDAIALKTRFRDMYEQKHYVLEGGGASLVVKCRLHARQKKVYRRVSLTSSKWVEARASTDSLVGPHSFHEILGKGEVMPVGVYLLVVRPKLISDIIVTKCS